MNGTNGQISLTRDLNSSDINEMYTFLIVATDAGSPPRSGSATIQVSIVDASNAFFYFSNSFVYFEVVEHEASHQVPLMIVPESQSTDLTDLEILQPTFEGLISAAEVSKIM